MLEIKCPFCGKRSQNEFAYGGDATIKRPKLGEEVSTKDWDDFVYFRDNPRGNIQNYGIMFQVVDNGLKFQEIQQHMKFLKLCAWKRNYKIDTIL